MLFKEIRRFFFSNNECKLVLSLLGRKKVQSKDKLELKASTKFAKSCEKLFLIWEASEKPRP